MTSTMTSRSCAFAGSGERVALACCRPCTMASAWCDPQLCRAAQPCFDASDDAAESGLKAGDALCILLPPGKGFRHAVRRPAHRRDGQRSHARAASRVANRPCCWHRSCIVTEAPVRPAVPAGPAAAHPGQPATAKRSRCAVPARRSRTPMPGSPGACRLLAIA